MDAVNNNNIDIPSAILDSAEHKAVHGSKIEPIKAIPPFENSIKLAPKNSSLMEKYSTLADNGYSVIPVNGKRPIGIGWQDKKQSTLQEHEAWAKAGYNIGILAKNTPAVDIDIRDKALALHVQNFFLKLLGIAIKDTVIRIGSYPKSLIPCRTDIPFPKITSKKYKSPDGQEHQIEILCDGQQFVAYGIHPNTKQPYYYPEKELLDVKTEDLPQLSRQQVDLIIAEFEANVPKDWVIIENGNNKNRHTSTKPVHNKNFRPPNIEEVKAALKFISADIGYEQWLKVLMALHNSSNGSLAFLELAKEWSSGTTKHKYNAEQVEKKWHSFSDKLEGEGITIGTVYKWAMEAGWNGVIKTFSEVKESVNLLAVINGVVDIEWCKLIVEAKLSHAEAEVIINSLVARHAGSKRALNADLKDYRNKEKAKKKAEKIETSKGNRISILYDPLDMNSMIHESESAMLSVPGRYEILHNGVFYIRVKVTAPTGFHAIDATDKAAPDTAIFFIYDTTAMLLRMEQSIQFCIQGKTGLEEIPVPKELPKHMLLNPEVQAGVATGLITHPIVYPNGEVLIQHGFDEQSGLYLHSGGIEFINNTNKVLTRINCKRLIKKIHEELFGEFEFCDNDIDTAVAMSMLFTAVQRKILDIAPGFVVTANVQGSGKTTLARMVYIVLTGSDMPVTSLSPDANEAKKEITTHLMEQIEMMCIDNEPDGSTLRSPIIAKIVTASEFKGRILGYSKNATVKTNVLLVYTGNNLEVDADFVRRLLVCHLEPTCEKPEERTFKHPDIVDYCRSIRLEILADITTIIRSYILSGDVIDITPSGYPQWDELVRKPMVWAGYTDPIKSCNKTRDESPDIQGPIALVTALQNFYGAKTFTSTMLSEDITDVSGYSIGINSPELSQVFDEYYPMHKRDARGIGAVLKKIIGRRINGNYLSKHMKGGISQYSVV